MTGKAGGGVMAWGSRILGGVLVGSIGLLITGCQTGSTANIGGPVPGPMMAANDSTGLDSRTNRNSYGSEGVMSGLTPAGTILARAQLPDSAPPQPFNPSTAVKTP